MIDLPESSICGSRKRLDREEIFDAIANERDYQDTMYGANRHQVAAFILIMENQIRKAKDEWNNCYEDEALEYILQAAAAGVACLEEHGVYTSEKN